MNWILIIWMIGGAPDGGVVATSIRFNTLEACLEASKFLNTRNSGDSYFTKAQTVCFRDKEK